MKGFVTDDAFSGKKLGLPLFPQCEACGLYKGCKSPKLPPFGRGKRKILLIAESPGAKEDAQGTQLVGESSQKLITTLAKFGIDIERDCVLTTSIICHREGAEPPSNAQIGYCRPNIQKVIQEFDPVVVVPLGTPAIKSLMGIVWRDSDIGGVEKWNGFTVPCTKPNIWICPTYHPSAMFYDRNPVLEMRFTEQLQAASELRKKPWEVVPDYKSQVEVILDHTVAACRIERITEEGAIVSFDYETNCKKPHTTGGEIICCSVSTGKKTIAFPWHGDVLEAMSNLLSSDSVRKLSQNLKFEDTWTRKILGHKVKNWLRDTMLANHWMDCRQGINDLKFMSFIYLGMLSYDDSIAPYRSNVKGTKFNRLWDVDMKALCLYCGMDSLATYLVWERQLQIMKERKNG
jgi:uracil-DNA glycosylase family 4